MRRMVVWMAAALLLATAAPPSAALSAEPVSPPVTAPDVPAARPAVDDTLRHALDILRQDLKELSGKVETNGLDIARLQGTSNGQDTLRQDVKELSGKIETNDREIVRLESASSGQDQRLSDINNRIGDVNLWLAGFSAIVTLLLAVAGVFTYFRAQEKARAAAQAWIDGNAATLRQQLDELKAELERETEGHKVHIKRLYDEDVKYSEELHQKYARLRESIGDLATSIFVETKSLMRDNSAMASKPERDYTVDDWIIRAFNAASRTKWDEAAVCFAKAADLPGANDGQVTLALFNKGISLRQNGRLDEAISAYNELIRRFADVQDPELSERVARAQLNKGFALGELDRHEEAIATYNDLLKRLDGAQELNLCKLIAQALLNKGNSLQKSDRDEEAIFVYYELQRRFGDRLEPELREAVKKSTFLLTMTRKKQALKEDIIVARSKLSELLNDPEEPEVYLVMAHSLAEYGWESYQSSDFAQFLALTERALAAEPQLGFVLANRAFALHLLGQPAAKVLAAYARARRVITDPVKWRELAVEDLQKHAERWPEAAPIDAMLIAAVAAM